MFLDMTIPRWAACAVVIAALGAGACGSGAVEGPEDDTRAADEQADGGGGDGGGDGGVDGAGSFSWNLPVGDISPDGSTDLYVALRSSCAEGETALAAELIRPPNTLFPPELRKLYEAAVAICFGDVERGRELYAEGADDGGYGHGCLVHEAVLSVLEQRPQDISDCRYTKREDIPSEEETPTTEGEPTTTSTEGGVTTTTSSAGGGGDAPVESGGEGDDGA
jgi:hypothetical protein